MNYPLALTLLAALPVTAQQNTSRLYSIGIGAGAQKYTPAVFPAGSWERLPGFVDPQQTDTTYTSASYVRYDVWKPVYSADVMWKLPFPKGRTWLVGAVLSAGRTAAPVIQFSKMESFMYDTLFVTDPQTSFTTIYIPGHIDSTYMTRYEYESARLNLSPRLLFKSNDLKRWSWFAGVQADFGIALKTALTKVSEVTVVGPFNSPYQTYGPIGETVSNSSSVKREKNALYTGVTVPAGICFRLGKADSWWSKLAVSAEASAAVFAMRVPEMKRSFAGHSLQTGVRMSYLF